MCVCVSQKNEHWLYAVKGGKQNQLLLQPTKVELGLQVGMEFDKKFSSKLSFHPKLPIYQWLTTSHVHHVSFYKFGFCYWKIEHLVLVRAAKMKIKI